MPYDNRKSLGKSSSVNDMGRIQLKKGIQWEIFGKESSRMYKMSLPGFTGQGKREVGREQRGGGGLAASIRETL